MKKYAFLIVLAVITVNLKQIAAQELSNTEKSLKEWHQNYCNAYNSSDYTKADKYYATDVIIISNEFKVNYENIIKSHKDNSKSLIYAKYKIDSVEIKVISPESAYIIGFGYGIQKDTSGRTYNMRLNYSMYVEKISNEWKIKYMHEIVNFYALGFGDDVDEGYRNSTISQNYRYRVCLGHLWAIFLLDLEYMKSNGIELNDYAKSMGESFAKGWNAEGGFEGYCRGMIRNCQVISTEVKLIEKTDEILRLRVYKYYKRMLPPNISDKEFLDFWVVLNNVIAHKMGAKLTVDDDEDYFVMNVNKQ